MDKFLSFLGGLVVYAINIFVGGIVLMFMWNWFIVPLGVVKIGFWLALGISLTIICFFGKKTEHIEAGEFVPFMIGNIISLLLIWGVGAIVQLFL